MDGGAISIWISSSINETYIFFLSLPSIVNWFELKSSFFNEFTDDLILKKFEFYFLSLALPTAEGKKPSPYFQTSDVI